MDMDLVSAFSGMQQAKVAGEIQTRLARKALDIQQQDGANVLKLIQSASRAGKGDSLVAAATGLGGNLDTYA